MDHPCRLESSKGGLLCSRVGKILRPLARLPVSSTQISRRGSSRQIGRGSPTLSSVVGRWPVLARQRQSVMTTSYNAAQKRTLHQQVTGL